MNLSQFVKIIENINQQELLYSINCKGLNMSSDNSNKTSDIYIYIYSPYTQALVAIDPVC